MKTSLFKFAIVALLGMMFYSVKTSAIASSLAVVAPAGVRRKPGANGRPTFNAFKNPTPQGKLVSVMEKFGSPGFSKQQGSTLIKYDILPLTQGLTAGETFTFFEEAQTRKFPFTNLTDGKMQVGEAMTIQRIYFFIVSQVDATGDFTDVESFNTFTIDGANLSVFQIRIANNRVVKPTPVFSPQPEFNRFATFADYNVFHFDTDIVIPTLIEFAVDLKVPSITVPTSQTLVFYIGCAIEGLGGILAPRATF